jgi:hypothetical protein
MADVLGLQSPTNGLTCISVILHSQLNDCIYWHVVYGKHNIT